MIPKLYGASETTFTSAAEPLVDCVRCEVTEERNGEFILELEYPQDGLHAMEFDIDKIILAKPYDNATAAEPFRINNVTATLDGHIIVNAEHISYQLNHIIIGANSGHQTRYPATMWNTLVGYNLGSSNPFSFATDISDASGTVRPYGCEVPTPLRTLLGGMEGSMLDLFGGELQWNKYTVNLWRNRGADNGVVIAYGKNIVGFDYVVDMDSVYTGLVAYYKTDNDYVQSDQQTIATTLAFSRIAVIDATSEFETVPTTSDLNTWASGYLVDNHINPKISVTVDFVPLWQTEEYKDFYALEHVSLCDTVKVIYTPLNLVVTAKVVKTVYDALSEKYTEIVIGTPGASLDDTIAEIIKEVKITK